MNKRTEDKLKDLSGMNKAISELLGQAWERGYKYGYACGIENAPTVDAYTEDDVKTAIKEGHQVGYEMAKAKFERPTDLLRELKDCRNELCYRCGQYANAHLGACDGCRWNDEHMKRWEESDK